MAQLASDPALATTTLQETDLVVGLRQVLDAGGNVTGYAPYNITLQELAAQIVQMGLLQLGGALPGITPAGGGLFLNAGAFSYSAVAGTQSGTTLTAAAMSQSYAAWLASLPAADPGTGPGTFWNNNGLATESVASA